MTGQSPPDPLPRLDPDRAARERGPGEAASDGAAGDAGAAGRTGARAKPPPAAFDHRRYQWYIGALAVVLVVAFSAYRLTSTGVATVGVPPGHAVRVFSAPLAGSGLVGDANLQPPCTAARHDRRALNVCLELERGPLVLDFVFLGVGSCERSVSALAGAAAALGAQGPAVAAVTVRAGPREAAAAVRKHRWSIPVAYDRDGAVGATYGVAVCPLLELVGRDGRVIARLAGERWQTTGALEPQLRALEGK